MGHRLVTLLLLSSAAALSAAEVPQLKLEEVAAGAKLSIPLRSETILSRKGVPSLSEQELPAIAEADYKAKCAFETYRATGSSSFLTHHSDIPELDEVMPLQMGSMIQSASCAAKPELVSKAGFTQANGALEVQLKAKIPAFESADRRLLHVSLPVVVHSGWGTFETGKSLYRRQCDHLRETLNTNGLVFLSCTEPVVEIKCCGNADLVGEIHALVYAYAANKVATKTFTAPTVRALALQTDTYIGQVEAEQKDKLAFAYCTPPSWEYAPVMAQQAHCYTMTHTYAPKNPAKTVCVGDFATSTEKGKVYASYADIGGKAMVRMDAKTDRAYRGWNYAPAELKEEGTRKTLTTANLILGFDGAMGNLHGFDTHIKGAPVDISVICK